MSIGGTAVVNDRKGYTNEQTRWSLHKLMHTGLCHNLFFLNTSSKRLPNKIVRDTNAQNKIRFTMFKAVVYNRIDESEVR